MIRRMPGRRIVGTPDAVAAEVNAFAAETAADEVMLMTMIPDLDVRRRTLELMAEHLGTGTGTTTPASTQPAREMSSVAE
jgi:alkanesulfonate monooxygenase SsuD/methylene tetrahydromethanopterin reductase-like flavin-dependent oxidoreductase (luciferase family)